MSIEPDSRPDTRQYRKVFLDESVEDHRSLAIYRTGTVNAVRLADADYVIYESLSIPVRVYAALFHFGVIDALNKLHFVSETGNGLDSWDEAYLDHAQIPALLQILNDAGLRRREIPDEEVMLGWQDAPELVSYWIRVSSGETEVFLESLKNFVERAALKRCDVEFIL
ncbi:MAG: hypothetical protein IAF08_10515 [Rhizobacter sp.]|nr:hypothetical protein [Chlorobiales bacterium]